MVKLADRDLLKQKYNVFNRCLDSFNYALDNRDMISAKNLLKSLQEYRNQGFSVSDSIIQKYHYQQKVWIDSLMHQARIREDSSSYAEAFYYYRRVAEFDSTQVEAIAGMHRVDSLLMKKNRPQSSGQAQVSEKKSKTPEEIDALFQSGISRFIAGEYREALKQFKEVLKYNPNHTRRRNI